MPDVDLRQIARGTPGFSGADLANLMNEAALFAVRGGRAARSPTADLDEARDKVLMGVERRSLHDDRARARSPARTTSRATRSSRRCCRTPIRCTR